MPLVTDPDSLSQGAVTAVADLRFSVPSGTSVSVDSAGGNLPTLADNDFFEIRGAINAENNGLYQVNDATPLGTQVTADKVTGSNPVASAVDNTAGSLLGNTTTPKSVMFDTATQEWAVIEQGNVDSAGATYNAVYSFAKEEWKNDAALIPHPFPFVSITDESYETGNDGTNFNDWTPFDDATTTPVIRTRKMLRTGGWSEIDNAGVLKRQYFGVITLGTFEDAANDTAYFEFGTDTTVNNTVDYDFAGPVNEAVLTFQELGNPATCNFATTSTITRSAGDFTAEGYRVGGAVTIRNADQAGNNGTFTITAIVALTLTVSGTPFTTGVDTNAQLAADNRSSFRTRVRVRDGDANGKRYDSSDLAAIGVTTLSNKVERFPLSNDTDLNISETDANIDANSPYTEVRVRYLGQTYNREVDSATKRDFGVVIDVGTYSRANGASATSTLFSSANLNLGTGEALTDYTGGSLIIHEGTDQGTHTISGTPVDSAGTLQITLTVALTATESNLSFTMERATPLTATKTEIYEKVQRELRQTTDIDQSGTGVVVGRAAADVLQFVGATLETLETTNPNSATDDGVIIEGFDTNDTNDLAFRDNTGTPRTFPFVAAGNLNFNNNLVNDSMGQYWMFFTYTTRVNLTDGAIVTPTGNTGDLESPGSNLPALAVNDYINVSGFVNPENNGIYQVTAVNTSTQDYTVIKLNGDTLVAESGVTIDVDQNPIDSPDAIIVDNNAGADIAGSISGATIAFDFDYDNNVQGGRTAATDAVITLRAIGLETSQFVEASGTITRNTGLSFTLTGSLERNYSNP